jgi:hypothetical protein
MYKKMQGYSQASHFVVKIFPNVGKEKKCCNLFGIEIEIGLAHIVKSH